MNFENKKRSSDSPAQFSARSLQKESFQKIHGEIIWKLSCPRTGNIQDSGHLTNLVTLDASILLARLLKSATSTAHQSEPSFGAFALAVGTGDVGWNNNSPPSGTNTQRSLFNEIARKRFATTNFVTPNGQISAFPTNVIDIATVFSESEAVGGICEMGIIGGDMSTNMSIRNPILPANGNYDPTVNTVGFDSLINYVTFPVINKSPTSSFSWVWRLTL